MQLIKNRLPLVILAVVVILGFYGVSSYNSLVTMDETASSKWAEVEVQYQRRADLIPNLVNTVKGYATHEKDTLVQLTEARSKTFQTTAGQIPSAEELKQFEQAQGTITAALGRLIAIAENYPELKANQNFLELQAQLEGTENRIAVARKDFNDAIKSYNTSIRRFPASIFASIFGFDTKAYLEAQANAQQAPQVSF